MTRVDFTTCRTTALIVMVTVLSCRAFAGRPQVEDLSPVAASSEIPRVDYLRDVKPLLEKRCFACHGALAQKGALRLDTGTLVRKGGDSGSAVVPEKPGESLLLDRVSEPDPKLRMPPEGEPLTAGEIETLSRWISAGADSPPDETPQTDPREHWAFRKPVRPAVPRVRSTGNGNPVDAFLLQPLEAQGIEPLPEAGRLVLLRRVTLDLTGLPPTRGEQQAFLADDSPDAYEKVVDRLLDSPQYGERWGRHWMDVWRYSDWYGRRAVPDVMNSYPQIWRWRDWIVRSLNSDKGYDQMVQEMLAADEIAPSDEENVVATGFLVRNWFKWNYETWMKDNVEHTGKAFLGLTLNCCHCHDHKYDPLTHEEYFRFRAFFEPLELRHDRVPGVPDPGPFKKYIYGQSYGPIAHGRIRVFDEKLDAQTFMYANGDARNRLPNKPPVEPGVPAILGNAGFTITPVALPPDAFYPGMKPQLRAEDVQKAQTEVAAADALLKQSEAARALAERQLADAREQAKQPATAGGTPANALISAERALVDARLTHRVDDAHVAFARSQLESLVARVAADDRKYRDGSSAGELAQAASLTERRAAFDAAQLQLARAERGLVAAERKAAADEKAQPEVVAAVQQLTAARTAVDAARAALAKTSDSYTPLSPLYPARSTGRRAALARWIVSRDNPLAARVAVNHIWLRHFGRALVESTANFGRQGRLPSHPQLLDWLAVELMENGWRMKPLHRLLVTSQAYRRQSHLGASTHPNLAADRDNRLYWRFNPQRMQAEVVRDSVLCCAEELDPTLGGQELDHVQGLTSKRRSLYFAIHGEAKMQFLDLFDGPSVVDCYQRSSSVLPQQSLAMLNSELLWPQSRRLAGKLWSRSATMADSAGQAGLFVQSAFEQILNRPPSAAESAVALDFLAEQTALFQESATIPAEAVATASTVPPASDPAQRARENLVHALFSHNDFVTIR